MNKEITTTQPETPTPAAPRAFAAPPVDVFENEDVLRVITEVPGVAAEDVKIDLEQDILSLQASRKDQPLDYRRRFSLSVQVDSEAVKADLEHGVLTIDLPKAQAAKRRSIPVAG